MKELFLRHRIFHRQPVKYFIGYITGNFCDRLNLCHCEGRMLDRSSPVQYPAVWRPDIWPVTVLNSLSQYVQTPNGAYVLAKTVSLRRYDKHLSVSSQGRRQPSNWRPQP